MDVLTPREKVAETVLTYYRLAEANLATAVEFAQWLDRLAVETQLEFLAMGLTQVLALPIFKRYVLEKRGYSMRSYMLAHLTTEELGYWVDDNDGGVRP